MRPLSVGGGVQGRSPVRLSAVLALPRHALMFRPHCSALAASIGPPKKRRQRVLAAFARGAPQLHAADQCATPRALP